MGSVKRRIALVGVATLGIAAVPAAAFPPSGGTEQETLHAPGSGVSLGSTDQIPAKSTDGSIDLEPSAAEKFGQVIVAESTSVPKWGTPSRPVQQTLNCQFDEFGHGTAQLPSLTGTAVEFGVEGGDPLSVTGGVCTHVVSQPVPKAKDAARFSSVACVQLNVTVSAQLTRSRSGYRADVKGSVRKGSVPSPLAFSCRRRGNGLHLTIRPRRRGRTLRQVGVTILAVALYNPTHNSVAVRTTFTVHVAH